MTEQTVILRPATAADERRIRDLAALDSRRLPASPFLVAEVDGEVRAALSLTDGAAVADPFRLTAHLVDLLHEHGAARTALAAGRPQRRRLRRPRLAFGV